MTNKIFESEQDFVEQYREACVARYGTPFEELADHERYYALAELIANKGRAIFPDCHKKEDKKVYYFSLEFLLGPLLDNYLINFGVRDLVAKGVESLGTTLEDLCRQEVDPGLGNGGLGRLAACFLDSMAHEGIAGYGNGMRYRYGLFRQYIEGGPGRPARTAAPCSCALAARSCATRPTASSGSRRRAASSCAPCPTTCPSSATAARS